LVRDQLVDQIGRSANRIRRARARRAGECVSSRDCRIRAGGAGVRGPSTKPLPVAVLTDLVGADAVRRRPLRVRWWSTATTVRPPIRRWHARPASILTPSGNAHAHRTRRNAAATTKCRRAVAARGADATQRPAAARHRSRRGGRRGRCGSATWTSASGSGGGVGRRGLAARLPLAYGCLAGPRPHADAVLRRRRSDGVTETE